MWIILREALTRAQRDMTNHAWTNFRVSGSLGVLASEDILEDEDQEEDLDGNQ